MTREHEADPAILHKDVGKRLDAIVRRHGGKPKPDTPPGRVVLPTPGRRTCKGQLPLIPTYGERLAEAREDEGDE